MITIYKYPLAITDEQTIEIFRQHRILSIQYQGDKLMMWAQVDTETQKIEKRMYIYGTGHELNPTKYPPKRHVATVITPDQVFVWHIYEVAPGRVRIEW